MGVVDTNKSNHRLVGYLKDPELYKDSHLHHIGSELASAVEFADQHGLHPIFDVCNRLGVVLPTPAELAKIKEANLSTIKDNLIELSEMLDCINKKGLVPQWAHLRMIKGVLLVAGGQQKQDAIFTLLLASSVQYELDKEKGRELINDVATDRDTARFLIRAREGYDELLPTLRDWYKETLRCVGLVLPPARVPAIRYR